MSSELGDSQPSTEEWTPLPGQNLHNAWRTATTENVDPGQVNVTTSTQQANSSLPDDAAWHPPTDATGSGWTTGDKVMVVGAVAIAAFVLYKLSKRNA